MSTRLVGQIEAAIQARLQTIVAGNSLGDLEPFHCTPAAVLRRTFGMDCLDPSLPGPIYTIDRAPGTVTREEGACGEIAAVVAFDLVLAHLLSDPDEQPMKATDLTAERITLQDRMLQDVERRLHANDDGELDLSLGGVVVDDDGNGVVENVMIVADDESAETVGDDQWAVALMRVQVRFAYRAVMP